MNSGPALFIYIIINTVFIGRYLHLVALGFCVKYTEVKSENVGRPMCLVFLLVRGCVDSNSVLWSCC